MERLPAADGDLTPSHLETIVRESITEITTNERDIAIARALIELLAQTGETTVQAGLDARGVTLEEYLTAVGLA